MRGDVRLVSRNLPRQEWMRMMRGEGSLSDFGAGVRENRDSGVCKGMSISMGMGEERRDLRVSLRG